MPKPGRNTESMYEVPFNWSEKFLEFIQDKADNIDSVYGSLPYEPTGRPIPHKLDQLDLPDDNRLRKVIEQLKSSGIDFHLIMNASCTGNTLFTNEGKRSLENKVKSLEECGIGKVVVANFDLARRISAINPNLRILMSVIFNITEPDQLMYL